MDTMFAKENVDVYVDNTNGNLLADDHRTCNVHAVYDDTIKENIVPEDTK